MSSWRSFEIVSVSSGWFVPAVASFLWGETRHSVAGEVYPNANIKNFKRESIDFIEERKIFGRCQVFLWPRKPDADHACDTPACPPGRAGVCPFRCYNAAGFTHIS